MYICKRQQLLRLNSKQSLVCIWIFIVCVCDQNSNLLTILFYFVYTPPLLCVIWCLDCHYIVPFFPTFVAYWEKSLQMLLKNDKLKKMCMSVSREKKKRKVHVSWKKRIAFTLMEKDRGKQWEATKKEKYLVQLTTPKTSLFNQIWIESIDYRNYLCLISSIYTRFSFFTNLRQIKDSLNVTLISTPIYKWQRSLLVRG